MNTTTSNDTKQNTIDPIDPVNDPTLDPFWLQTCKIGQEMAPELVQIMADSATQAITDWLHSINAPEEVIDLHGDAGMLAMYDTQLADGIALSPMAGANLLDIMVSAGKNMRAVGAQFCKYVLPNDMPGTLPRYTLQAIDPATVSA